MLKLLTVSQQPLLKEIGVLEHFTCLLRNLYAGQEATIWTGRGTTDWFKIGKRVQQGCILLPQLFNLYEEYITQNARLNESQAGIKIVRKSTTSDMQMTPLQWQKVREELKNFLMRVKEETEKADLTLNI